MKRQLSIHNKSQTIYNKSQHVSMQKNRNPITLNHNSTKQQKLVSQHSLSQLQNKSKTPLAKRQSNQVPPQDFYFMTNPTTVKPKNQTLKRSSMIKNKYQKSQQNQQKASNESDFNKKSNLIQVDQKIYVKQDNYFMTPKNDSKQSIMSKQNSIKKALINFGTNSTATLIPKGQFTLESKWDKIIELYTLRDELSKKYQFPSAAQLKKKYPILPSGQFYRILAKTRVFQKQWKINFPETIFLDNDGNTVMIYTDDRSGILKKRYIEKESKQKDSYKEEVLKFKQDFVEKLHQTNKIRLFKSLRIDQNPNAPLSIMKYTQDNAYQFQTDVQSHRNFIQRKLKPTRDSIMQRYIYSNNLKAMVFRLYYKRHNLGDNSTGPEYQGIKFENEKSLFKDSGAYNFPQTHKLTSTITLSDKRIGTLKVIPINNPRTLQKYIIIGKEVQKMLEYTEKTVINKLYIDFIVDVFDKPWVINIKYCEVNPHSLIQNIVKQDHTNNVSSCRLCGVIERKQNLKNSVSVRMLCEFIHHLKKRTKQEDLHKIDFIQNLNINSKQNKTSLVCNICYKVIIHELQLIKMQKQLAQICNVIPHRGSEMIESQQKTLKNSNNSGQYKQWRLMLYFQDIKYMHGNFQQAKPILFNPSSLYHQTNKSKNQSHKTQSQFFLKYQLCPKIYQTFLCKKQTGSVNNLKINQVKLHYFYSENTNIQEFINNTQIMVSLYSADETSQVSNHKQTFKQSQSRDNDPHRETDKYEKACHNEKLIASGSTHVLSSFNLYKSCSFSLKTLMENGQKQTATVLLFFQNKKYCELTLRVGLVCDGSYNVNNIPSKRQNNSDFSNYIKWNQVWFSKNLWNSNPLPKQWMEIFGSKYNYDNTLYSLDKQSNEEENDQEMLKKVLQSPNILPSDQQNDNT